MCNKSYCAHRWVAETTTTGCYRNDTTWRSWIVENGTTTDTRYAAQAWEGWVTTNNTSITFTGVNGTLNGIGLTYANGAYRTPAPPTAPPTAAEIEAQRLASVERTRVNLERLARAEALLVSCLTPEQQTELEDNNQFHVTTRSGRRYCIQRGRAGNVKGYVPISDGRTRMVTYCIHDQVGLPFADTMLGQKLMLETNEDEFLRIANASY